MVEASWPQRTTRLTQPAYRMTRLTAREPSRQPANASLNGRLKVAYMMSRFPKITETFILYEIIAVEQQGVQVELYPLLREKTSVMHPEAAPLVQRAHFQPFISLPIIRANLRFLVQKPAVYLKALWDLLRATWGSFRFLRGAIGLFPKSVYFAGHMQKDGIQHIHAHFASHPAAAAFVIHRLVGIPYSFTGHGSDLHRDRDMLREKVEEAAFVNTISHFNRELIVRECGEQYRDKISIIRCGVDTNLFTLPDRRRESGRPFNILCIGTLHEVKGQTQLIAACRELQQRGIEFVCHLAGDGPDLGALTEQAAQAGLTDRMIFHGRLVRQEIVRLLQNADVVAAPSVSSRDGRREGIPVALMEAMGAGLAVVASDLSGIPELVQHEESGLLVPPGDVRQLADALQRLHDDAGLRARLGQAARVKVLREFDLHTNAGLLVERIRAAVTS